MVGKTDFPANEKHFSLSIFQRLPPVFFRLVEKYFSTKSFIPAGGNGFSLVETFTKINESQFLKKVHILTNENRFLG